MTTGHEVTSPIDGSTIATIELHDESSLDAVVARAVAAADRWRRTPPRERAALLFAVARRIREELDDIAELETRNCGKLLADTRREVERAARCFEYYGGYADKVTGTVVPVGDGFHTYTTREPYGVVAGIVPWNAPFVFAAKKIAPALAFGNVSILKPALETPLTAMRLGELLDECGAPPGVAQVVGGGPDVGRGLVADPRVDLVVFTGSDGAGRHVGATAAERLVPSALELGGKSPQLVFADADLDAAAAGVVEGFAGSCGQMCIAGSRLFVERSVHDEFVDRLVARVAALRVGDPRLASSQVGPQATAAQAAKTREYVADAKRSGRVLAETPLEVPDDLTAGNWVAPVAFADLPVDHRAVRDEIFGPVLSVAAFDDADEALALAHDTEFGLAAGLWTGDIGRAHRLASDLRVGTVWVNTYRILDDMVPFGGVGQSGYGRENGTEAPALYTWAKSVWVSVEPGVPQPYRKDPS